MDWLLGYSTSCVPLHSISRRQGIFEAALNVIYSFIKSEWLPVLCRTASFSPYRGVSKTG